MDYIKNSRCIPLCSIICVDMTEAGAAKIELGIRPTVSGPGLELLKKGSPTILATTHFTDADPQYAVFGLKDRLGGLAHISVGQSSSHDSWQRPMYKAGTWVINKVTRIFRSTDMLHSIGHDYKEVQRDGETVMSQPGLLRPMDWIRYEDTLKNGNTFVTAAYFDEKNYFRLPKKTGLLPIILKHSVPEAGLFPVATVFDESVYTKREHFPLGKPTIVVGTPVELPSLTWKSEESEERIANSISGFKGSPIEFFAVYLQKRNEGERFEDASILNQEMTHITGQLKDQSILLMQEYKKLIPPYIPSL
jgi:hypothetical protein